MTVKTDFYMEPILFSTKSQFLSGTTQEIASHEVIFDEDKAKTLLFSQFPPTEYMIWGDFFSEEISEILLNKKYQESQESIKNHTPKAKESELKEHIRKRKEFLLRKKAGLPVNNKYDDFKKEFSDEAIYILNMISTQRYLLGEKKGSILESIFDIFKTGCLPCGVKKEKKEIVIFNPIKLKD